MTVHEVTPAIDLGTLLTGAQFADAFRIEITDRKEADEFRRTVKIGRAHV